ncbi:MAG: thiamine diphosphokinase [Clostridia bacterium]|nr:thiamine diphosphokinase [Clostridia bacterium]MBQ8333004.1 thiamine diphosphokinase [Clostridia bacterium]MBQ8368898.1 thiamine diphosphokinase [Clostridia bacterium]
MEKTMTALVITGGYCNVQRAKKMLPVSADLVIAADSGYATAQELGITPDITMGDFDSYREALPPQMKILRVPCEKDDTDTMLACEYARDHGCTYITIVGGTGGRIDHSISNVFYLEDLRRQGIRVKLTDGENTVQVIMDETVTVQNDGGYFSIFALDTCVVSLTGCKYPLSRAQLIRQRPYAVSNEVTDECAVVTVQGSALLVTSRR